MACKIADSTAAVQPVSWHPAAGSSKPSAAPPARAPLLAPAHSHPGTVPDEVRQAELAQCRKSALQEGIRQGKEEAAGEVKGAADRLAHTLRDLALLKRKLRSEAESDLVKLSLAIARRVLHRELTTDPESIAGVVHAAITKLNGRDIARVRTAPAAVEPVRGALERAGAGAAVAVIADAKMRLGDLVFETAAGELDASVDSQIREIERGFADRLGPR